jgi:hypothetical protein
VVVSTFSWPSHRAMTRRVDPGFEEAHGGGVAQYVGGDVLAPQRRARPGRLGGVEGDAVFDGVAAEHTSSPGREQRVGRVACAFSEPGARISTVPAPRGVMRSLRPLP